MTWQLAGMVACASMGVAAVSYVALAVEDRLRSSSPLQRVVAIVSRSVHYAAVLSFAGFGTASGMLFLNFAVIKCAG